MPPPRRSCPQSSSAGPASLCTFPPSSSHRRPEPPACCPARCDRRSPRSYSFGSRCISFVHEVLEVALFHLIECQICWHIRLLVSTKVVLSNTIASLQKTL